MGPELNVHSIAIFYSILLACVAAAFLRGGKPEKAGAATLMALFAIQAVVYASVPPRFLNVDLISFAVDILCLGAMSWIAINAKRAWPIWAASFQLLSVAAHFARYVQVEVEPAVYSIMKSAPTGFVATLILIGTVFHRTRLANIGYDQSWVDWKSVRSARSTVAIPKR